jgi:membrane-associated phospholipid phosphatase
MRPATSPAVVGSRARGALALAAASAVGFVAIGVGALAFEPGRRRDAVMLEGFFALDRSVIDPLLRVLALSVEPLAFALALVLLTARAARRDLRHAVAVVAILVGSGVTAQALKLVIDGLREPNFDAGPIEHFHWPSGHATAATALAICAVIVAPAAKRVVVALVAGCWALVVAYATLALTWHYPSEVLAGILLAGAWAMGALAWLSRYEAPGRVAPRPAVPRVVPALIAAATVAATAIVTAAASVEPLAGSDRAALALCTVLVAVLTLGLPIAAATFSPPEADRAGVLRPADIAPDPARDQPRADPDVSSRAASGMW